VMIHRALLGSIERFIGVLVEHYAGAFPMWLSPVQATIIPVADRHSEYAEKVGQKLQDSRIRIEVDTSTETVGEKIRRAITQKHPAVMVVGDNDVENGTVGFRLRGEDTEERGLPVEAAVMRLTDLARPPR